MFRIQCCNKQKKCSVFAIAKTRMIQSAYLKMCYCMDCGSFIVVIETTDFNGHTKIIRKQNAEAYELFEKNKHNILFEVKPIQNGKFGWYLKYCEFGRIKKCYSNLRTLKLGKFAGNFEDINNFKKNEFHNNKSTVRT